MENLRVIGWGWRKGGGWSQHRVERPVGAAYESLCRHQFRSDAERCIEQRNAGSDRCIDAVTPVSLELKRMLADLSVMVSDAKRHERAPGSLIATLEQIRAMADAIIVSIEPKRPAAPAIDLVALAKSALGVRS